ncbi:carbonic anhydrase [Mycena floridula]|nr:carbonic anhydrase [Mycena floridula]
MSDPRFDYAAKNASYAATFTPGDLPSLFELVDVEGIIVTCMDPRVDPYTQFGANILKNGVIQNGGGRTKDALRSIITVQQLGVRNVAVIHHTDCKLTHFSNEKLRAAVKKAHPGDEAATTKAVEEIDVMAFSGDIDDSVREDVEFLRSHPLILKETTVTGWTLDLETGKVHKVV